MSKTPILEFRVEDLFAPIPLSAFLNQYWLRRHWHQTGSTNRFSSILSSPDIEFLAASLIAHAGWISLVRDGVELNIAALKAGNGFISASKLRQVRANGFTVLLSSLQRRCPAISSLCRSLEAIKRGSW